MTVRCRNMNNGFQVDHPPGELNNHTGALEVHLDRPEENVFARQVTL